MKILLFCLIATVFFFVTRPFVSFAWKIIKPIALGTLFLLMALPQNWKSTINEFDHDDYIELKEDYNKNIKPLVKHTKERVKESSDSLKVWNDTDTLIVHN